MSEKQGLEIIDFAQEVMDSNLAEEKRRLLGIPQEPCAQLLHLTNAQIESMKGDELTLHLKTLGFPHTGYHVAEKKKILWYLTCESEEQRLAEMKAKWEKKNLSEDLLQRMAAG